MWYMYIYDAYYNLYCGQYMYFKCTENQSARVMPQIYQINILLLLTQEKGKSVCFEFCILFCYQFKMSPNIGWS